MVAHKGNYFSLICLEARLDCQPWGEMWSLDMLPLAHTAPGSAEHTAVTLLQCPCTMLLTHPSSSRPSCAQEWHSMALHRHVPASQFQLWPHCSSWGCSTGFLEFQIWDTNSKHNLRRALLSSQTEVTCTSGEFGSHFIWPNITLIAKTTKHQTQNLMIRGIWMESRHGH